MAKSPKEIADALDALMNGHVADDSHAEAAHHDEPAAPAPPPPAPAARQTTRTASPAAAKPASPPPAAAAATPQSTTRRPTPIPNPNPVPVASKIVPPPAPQAAPAVAKRPSRPAAPKAVAPAPVPQAPKPATSSTSSGTKRVSAPAKPAPVEYAKPVVKKPAKLPFYATIDFRQTVIPPLLVGGAGLIVMAILFFMQPSDAALRQLGATIPLVLGLIGGVLIGVAALKMTQVRKQLAERAAAAPAAKSR